MTRNTKAFALVLICLLFDDVFGQQAAGNLVFCKKRRGEVGTYLANAEGKDLKRLLFLCGPEISPRFSPDGKGILFSSVKGAAPSVYTANREGGDRKEICQGDQAAWSPDGSSIFFRRAGQIVQRVLASGEEKTVSPPAWKSCAFPDCSPDGKSVLFVAEVGDRLRLLVMTLEGKDPRALADVSVASPARWSPDGHRIAYSEGVHIFVMSADGGWKYRLTTSGGVERDPAWSPDGTTLVYCHAPTVNAGWSLCAAKADGTQARLLPKEDDVVSFFAPDWWGAKPGPGAPGAGVRASPRVSVWDIGGSPAPVPGKYHEFLKKREGWNRVSGAPALKGGAVVESQRAFLVPGSKACPVLLSAKPVQQPTDVVEIIPVSEKGVEAPNVQSLNLARNDGEEAVIEMASSTAGGERVRTSWRVSGACPYVQVSPVENAGGLRVRATMKYVVIPDRFADDLVYEAAPYGGARIWLPPAPLVLGLLGSGDNLLELACPSDGQTTDLLNDAGPGKPFSGAEIRFAKAPLIVGVLTGQRLWYEQRVNAKYERKRMNLNWEMPGPGTWRLAVRAEGRVYSDMFTDKESRRLDGKRLFLTEQEEFAGLVERALVYLYGRSSGTPLDQWTPVDLALDGMGVESFVRALDIDGLQSYRTAPRPTTWASIFDSLDSIRVLYERGVEKKEEAFVAHLCDDMPAFLEGMDGRLDAFATFARQAAELGKNCEKAAPQAQAFFAGIKPALDRLEDACKKGGKMAAATEALACAVQIKDLTAKDMKEDDKKKKFAELLEKISKAARGRADLIRDLRSAARELRDRTGMACVEHPELRDPAAKLRQLAQGVLRNRYDFEADWRGEPHRVAPYWLGSRPY
jgi:hypothetical protein